jgi:hypothetical protein
MAEVRRRGTAGRRLKTKRDGPGRRERAAPRFFSRRAREGALPIP